MAAQNTQQRHRSTLNKYLQTHSKFNPNSKACSVRLPHIHGSTGRDKSTVESLPDEILSLIFWKLMVGDLISASQVCQRWRRVSGDNLLWKKIYARFVKTTAKEKEDRLPIQELNTGFWRNLCLQRCKENRDKMYLKKWKHPDPYTGLKQRPELTLSQMAVRFELGLKTSDNQLHTIPHSDIYWSTMSVSVRWYALVIPDMKDIHCVLIHASSPLMFNGPSKPVKDGVVQKSLLMQYKGDTKYSLQKQKPLASDDQIQLFELQKGLNIALYKADGEIAFVTYTLHYHNLISRCLCGSRDRQWSPPLHPCTEDDIDPQYGLHGYTCVILIRNMRQKLLECRFTDLHTSRHAIEDGFATFNPVKKDDKMSHVACLKEIHFPWKTTLFKGIVQDVGILDITLLDESREPFWIVSSTVSVEESTQTNQFEFEPSTYKVVHYHDDTGKIHLEIGKKHDTGFKHHCNVCEICSSGFNIHTMIKCGDILLDNLAPNFLCNLDDGSQYLSYASISLSVTAINMAFKRSY